MLAVINYVPTFRNKLPSSLLWTFSSTLLLWQTANCLVYVIMEVPTHVIGTRRIVGFSHDGVVTVNILFYFSITFIIVIVATSHFPNIHNFVFRNRAYHPRLVRVPREVAHASHMAAVDEQELRRAVFRVVGGLLLADRAKI